MVQANTEQVEAQCDHPMVERVARALLISRGIGADEWSADNDPLGFWPDALADARAAIEAMRPAKHYGLVPPIDHHMINVWIDAALGTKDR